jgi:hypothetical protein
MRTEGLEIPMKQKPEGTSLGRGHTEVTVTVCRVQSLITKRGYWLSNFKAIYFFASDN